jgi:stress response protein YsnF
MSDVILKTGVPFLDMAMATHTKMMQSQTAMVQRMFGSVLAPLASPSQNALVVRGGESEQVVTLAEETLHVDTQRVVGETTQVRRFIVETPVERQVVLHDERVVVERRKPVTTTYLPEELANTAVEAAASKETAVARKGLRIKEEVVLRIERTQRTETIRETLRAEEVEIVEPKTVLAYHSEEIKNVPAVQVENKARTQQNAAAKG